MEAIAAPLYSTPAVGPTNQGTSLTMKGSPSRSSHRTSGHPPL